MNKIKNIYITYIDKNLFCKIILIITKRIAYDFYVTFRKNIFILKRNKFFS